MSELYRKEILGPDQAEFEWSRSTSYPSICRRVHAECTTCMCKAPFTLAPNRLYISSHRFWYMTTIMWFTESDSKVHQGHLHSCPKPITNWFKIGLKCQCKWGFTQDWQVQFTVYVQSNIPTSKAAVGSSTPRQTKNNGLNHHTL